MTYLRTLLVSQDSRVINEIQKLNDETEHGRLEICGRLDRVPDRLGRDVTLLLVHHGVDIDLDRVQAIFELADRGMVKAAILTSSAPASSDVPDDLRQYQTYHLPADLPALRELLVAAKVGTGRTRAEPPPVGHAVDPFTATLYENGLNHILADIRRVSRIDMTVLLTGETGCGKTMLAKFIHGFSPRRDHPYLVVDCGALSGQLIESEMFGHVRGAFTGADRDRQGKFSAAGPGTLVLDEINSLPLPLQAKLLRAVEDRMFEPVGSNRSEPLRARLVAISNVPLEEEVRKERFRADLYYRLNVVEFRIPSLRERSATIIPLVHQLLRSSATAACQKVTSVSTEALDALLAYPWPGNIRELRNVIERAAALADGSVIHVRNLPEPVRGKSSDASRVPTADGETVRPVIPPDISVIGDEASQILAVLRKHNNNRRQAAAELGMSRVSLYKKLHRYGMFIRKVRPAAAAV